MRLVLLLAVLAGCGTGDVSQCACKVSVGDASSSSLTCGDSVCLSNSRYGCDDDEVISLGRCGDDFAQPQLADGGNLDAGTACILAGASCLDPIAPCCATSGNVLTSCDPVTRTCCVAVGQACSQSADCCGGRSCLLLGGKQVCGS